MGFFSDVESDLSGQTADVAETAAQVMAESADLDSMLNTMDETRTPAEPAADNMVVTETFFETGDEDAPVMSAGDAMETEDTDDEFLSKLSEALGTTVQEDAAPEPEPVYESAAEEEVPVFESAPEEPVITEAPAEVYAASEPEPAPVFESAPAMPQFTAPETTQTTFAQQGGYAMEMDMVTAPATDENAVITAGMIVHGDVQTSGNLELMGKVTGNVRANGKLTISGEITGDSVAAEIYAENARVNGEVKSQGSVKIGQSTVIIGNIHANGAVIAGAVKGDIDVHGPVILDTTAIVMGNIKSQSVQINNGAVIEGMCSQVYAEVNPSAFFDNLKG